MSNHNSEFEGLAPPKPTVQLLKIDSIMPIGKYRGSIVRSILGQDPQYLQWFMDNVVQYQLDRDICDALTYSDDEDDDSELERFYREEFGYGKA